MRRNMRSGESDVGFLPAIGVGTLFVFYMVWAAMHDIAHANGSKCAPEYTALAISVPAFAFLYRKALLLLTPKAKVAWLAGTGVLLVLFDLGALSAQLHPKYAKDPMLGSLFLAAGLPVLGLIGYHLVREIIRRRTRCAC